MIHDDEGLKMLQEDAKLLKQGKKKPKGTGQGDGAPPAKKKEEKDK